MANKKQEGMRSNRFKWEPGDVEIIDEEPDVTKRGGTFNIAKSDDDKRQAFGWANVAIRKDGTQIKDYQEDIVDPEELEGAVYEYVKFYREGGEMHERGGSAVMIESVMLTKQKMAAMGIPEGTVPEGWWIGFEVTDDEVWKKVKDKTYSMFSIEGTAQRVPVAKKSGVKLFDDLRTY
jgi:hypothetical protein